MGADYIEYQDKHGKTKAFSLNIEALEILTKAAGRYGVPLFSTFIDGGRGVVELLERFDIPRKELAAELQVSQATVTNWTRRDSLDPDKAMRVLGAVSEILGRRGAIDPDADITAYVAGGDGLGHTDRHGEGKTRVRLRDVGAIDRIADRYTVGGYARAAAVQRGNGGRK